jgi:muramoyltetrapeptide carboxypeptidase
VEPFLYCCSAIFEDGGVFLLCFSISLELPVMVFLANNPAPRAIKRLGLFALSGAADQQRAERGLARLREFGLSVTPAASLAPRRYLAGDDAARLAAFYGLLLREDIDACMAVRGGFGAARLLDGMDWDCLRRYTKPIIGYSDVCALHLAALQHGCSGHIHGPMLCSEFGREIETPAQQKALTQVWSSLLGCVGGQDELLPSWATEEVEMLKRGEACGQLLPTNLALLCSLLGTAHFPSRLETPILVLEDIGEAAYRIDRYLTQLRSTGFLKRLRGLLFGQFSQAEDSEYIPEILREVAVDIDGPVACGVAFGHVFPSISLPVGAEVTLRLGDGCSMRRQQGASGSGSFREGKQR